MTNEELIAAFHRASHLAGIYDEGICETCDLESHEIAMGHFIYWDEEYGRLQDLMRERGLMKKEAK